MQGFAAYLVLTALVACLFSLPMWRFIDERASDRRGHLNTLDGVRGFLALGVMLHHAVVARVWLQTGVWALPDDLFYRRLGSAAVSLFFMITAFLFWGKLIKENGRPKWVNLYIGRVFRIAPVYWIAVTLTVLIVMARTGWTLNQPAHEFVKLLARWYALGAFFALDFSGYRDVWIIVAGVFWTLRYEWRFYLALIPLSIFARARTHLGFASLALIASLVLTMVMKTDAADYCALFAFGMFAASLGSIERLRTVPDWMRSIGVALLFALSFLLAPEPYRAGQTALLGLAFLLLCNGTTLFGLLTTRAAIRLGHISYSIYLLQGFVFSLGFAQPAITPYVTGAPLSFWIVSGIGMAMLCAVSAVIYAIVERPMIDAGHWTGWRVRTRVLRLRT